VAADALGPVARHQTDDERAGDRHEHDERSEMMARRGHERRVDALKKIALVRRPMSASSSAATYAAKTPMPIARPKPERHEEWS
jgi:hypothetical protein